MSHDSINVLRASGCVAVRARRSWIRYFVLVDALRALEMCLKRSCSSIMQNRLCEKGPRKVSRRKLRGGGSGEPRSLSDSDR